MAIFHIHLALKFDDFQISFHTQPLGEIQLPRQKKVNVTGIVQAFSALKATGTNTYKYITSTSHTWGHTRNMAEKEDSVRQGLHYGMMIEWVNLRQFQTACQRKASFFHFLVQYLISGSSFPPDLIIMKF